MSRFSFSLLYSMGQGCLERLNRRADQHLTHVDMRRLRHGVQDGVRDGDVLQDLRAGCVKLPSPVTACLVPSFRIVWTNSVASTSRCDVCDRFHPAALNPSAVGREKLPKPWPIPRCTLGRPR